MVFNQYFAQLNKSTIFTLYYVKPDKLTNNNYDILFVFWVNFKRKYIKIAIKPTYFQSNGFTINYL